MPVVRTVLGDIPPERLGITLPHEHITFSWGSAKRDLGELYDREAYLRQICADVSAAKRDHNVNTIVCVSAAEMGRDVDICAEVQRRTGVNIIASTGFHRQSSGTSIYFNSAAQDKIEEWMTKEITEGIGRNRIKCGNIKIGWDSYAPTPLEEKFYRAAGRVSRKLRTSIVMHTIYGGAPPGTDVGLHTVARAAPPGVNPGLHMVNILTNEGADPSKIAVSHAQSVRGNVAPLLEVLRRGANLCFEDLSKSVEKDTVLVGTVGALITAGYVKQIVLSLDHLASWQTKQPPDNVVRWVQDYSYLHREVISRMLKAGIKEKDIEQMTVINPRNFLSF